MADITVTTDVSQINNLKDALKSTDTLFVKVVDSLLREVTRANRVNKAFAQTTQQNLDLIAKAEAIVSAKLEQESNKREKARAREAAAAEKEAKRIADANQRIIDSEVKRRAKEEQAAANYAQNFQGQVGGNLGLGARGISAGASAGAFEAEIERLRQKYDQVYASSQLYDRSLQELNKAHMLGVMSTKQHEAAVESLNAEYQAFQSGVAQAGNRFTQHVNQTSDGMNKFGVAAQQTGYQVSDFIVQVQGGTNPLVAFSQQATQLAGLLYLLPASMQAARIGIGAFSVSMATATAGVTILIPLLAMLAMSFFSSSKEGEKAAQAVDKQKEAYDNLIQVIVRLREERAMLESGAATSEEQAILTQINQLELQRAGLLAESAEIAARINEEGAASLGNESIRIAAALEANAAERARLENVLRIADEERKRLSAAEAQRQAHADQVKYMGQAQNAQRLMTIAATEALDKYSKMRTVAAGLANELARGADETFRMAQQQSSLNYGKIMNTGDSGPDAARRGVIANMPNPFGVLTGGAGGVAPLDRSSGGGGGAGAGRIDSLINQLQTEREVLEEWYTESQESLTTASESELAIIGGYNEAKLRLAQEYRDRLSKINEDGEKSQLETVLSGSGEILSAMGAFSEKALRVSKAFAAAEALVSTYKGAAKALEKGVFGFAEAAAVIAKGIGFVAAIRGISSSGSSGGVGGGGSRGSATVAQSAAPATPQTVLISGLDPNALFTGEQLSRLFENFYKENDNRGKVFVVAR